MKASEMPKEMGPSQVAAQQTRKREGPWFLGTSDIKSAEEAEENLPTQYLKIAVSPPGSGLATKFRGNQAEINCGLGSVEKLQDTPTGDKSDASMFDKSLESTQKSLAGLTMDNNRGSAHPEPQGQQL